MTKKYVYTYKKKCLICGKEFETSSGGKKICSDECKKIYYKQRVAKLRKCLLEKSEKNLNHERYQTKTGVIVKVRATDYPLLKDYQKQAKGKNNPNYKYVLKSHKVWFDAGNGVVPEKHILMHLDGNDKNNDIKNLRLVNRKILYHFNRTHRMNKNPDITRANITLTELQKKIMEYEIKKASDLFLEIQMLYKSGLTLHEISKKYGISYFVLTQLNLLLAIPMEKIMAIKKMHEQGITIREIQKTTGYLRSTIQSMFYFFN